MDSSNVNTLITMLPAMAQMTCCSIAITDSEGRTLYAVNVKGIEEAQKRGEIHSLAQQTAKTGCPYVNFEENGCLAKEWILPLEDYVLVFQRQADEDFQDKLQRTFKMALPLIAKVAGGEAVLFNERGERLLSFDADGREVLTYKGKVSFQACEAMNRQQPVVGDSCSMGGAMAVRVPVTERFGFGFNNENITHRHQKLYEKVKNLQQTRYTFEDIIGNSESLAKTKSIARFVAGGISSILLSGETGTGKELFAQSIHHASERCNRPFVALNCGAMPASLIESNLFGYEEGAFTGAQKGGRAGAFEQANGGTIFLDEISEMELNLQTRLLRVLQEKEVVRIGGFKVKQVDVRIIASTNKNLNELIAAGKFRQDLYYRLNVVQIKIPPLRERQSDVVLLAKHFINQFNRVFGKKVKNIEEKALQILQNHSWPGNVRELQNCIEHAMNMVETNEVLACNHLPAYLFQSAQPATETPVIEFCPRGLTLTEALRNTEKMIIKTALERAKHKKTIAAKLLGISTVTLWRKLSEYGLEEEPGIQPEGQCL
ncbi:sigma-54 interaction domain-containing protein [Sporomusa acidovorans]|uniref:Anaerobic nitric oxide reductase transcription regulator NorR n=1 Tax=Sporomusa acidovorans (strain ATCC 49682 / DSM 3132 / Mol) TaxID=1123286 RepID=A0ABZ3J8J3_SPOA4|nr:sigma 54-interacting transcriptional regulator [Sporomusa acidovorans]OZC16723.1 arginine utilization regulatory protein RocR [Sporomusa acidovorans DSM 3132]SDE04729.1 regulatory protein, Fis family [Sporomusa acidovorans]